MTTLDETHDPALRSWVESANDPSSDFPIQNLPFGVFTRADSGTTRVGIAIGDQVLDVVAANRHGLLSAEAAIPAALCDRPALNELMALGRQASTVLRRAVSGLLSAGADPRAQEAMVRERIVLPAAEVALGVPARIGDYTDFYASIHHATNIGRMLRPDNPLLPNYKYVPIGYHGRASSIVPSGSDVRRPSGQTRDDQAQPPAFGPTRRLDYELEVGMFIGEENRLGHAISIANAPRHIFGFCLLNDWSARDVQAWEYQPLGPFLAKSFATTVSPWVVTAGALEPYRVRAFPRPADDPAPLEHLLSLDDIARGGIDLTLEVWLSTAEMRCRSIAPFLVSRGDFLDMYWTVAQLVTHHTSNGCNLRAGDLLGSGTVSGPTAESRGCLMERSWRGTEPLVLPSGERRSWVEDDDEIVLRGYCERPGYARIGFGECRGRIIPANSA